MLIDFNLELLIVMLFCHLGTFKLKKKDLQTDGYNPNKINDKLYYLDQKLGYQQITTDVYEKIEQGKIKF